MLWLMAMALVVAAGIAVAGVAALIALRTGLAPERAIELLLDPAGSPLVTTPTWISISILASDLVLALLVWRFLRRHRLFLHEVCPLGVPSLRDLSGALLCVFGLAPLSRMLAELARRHLPHDVNNAETMVVSLTQSVSPLELGGVLFATALVPAVVEELLFRGVLTRGFLRSNLLAVCVPSAMFGLFHLEPTQAAGAFVLGVGFGIARLYTDSVLTSIACHLAYNAYELIDVYSGGQVGSTDLQLGRVAVGLAVAAVGFGLMVVHPGQRRPSERRK